MSTNDQLRAFVERVERIEEEIKTLNDDKSDIYKEIRSVGFDVKTVRKVVAKRKIDDHVRSEQDALFDTYWDALHGSGLVHVHVRENIEQFDPLTGEFVDDEPVTIIDQTDADGHHITVTVDPQIAAILARSDERRSDGGLDIVTKHTEIATNEGGANQDSVDMAQGSVPDLEPSGPDVNGQPNSPEEAPKFLTKAEEGAEATGTATVDPVSRAEAETDRQRSPEAGPTDGRRQGGVEPSAKAVAPAPSFLTKPPSSLRPNCRNPGESCGGYGDVHCHACKTAVREKENAA